MFDESLPQDLVQATKLRRSEHSVEELLRRVATLEDEVRQRSGPRDGYLEAPVAPRCSSKKKKNILWPFSCLSFFLQLLL